MRNPTTCKDNPPKRQPMVSGSEYYRNRADVERGLKRRDFPSQDLDDDPSEKRDEKKVDAEKLPSKR
ncbi:hypothetical protein ACMDCR_03420 [Labrys okinawensis]|uniref:hypothetical protein n=1 Tax=Labrys okinawensis TaxID=346911 RepID=UPI0039BC27A8